MKFFALNFLNNFWKKEYVMKKYTVDRFEGDYAVCETEDNSFVNIQRNKLPKNTKEGDFIIEKEDGAFFVDTEATEERRKLIRKKLDSLFE